MGSVVVERGGVAECDLQSVIIISIMCTQINKGNTSHTSDTDIQPDPSSPALLHQAINGLEAP